MAILDLGKIKLLWRNAWSTGTNYEQDDVVYHNSNIWICKKTHTASTSGEGTNRFAPGEKFRTSAYGEQYDPDKEPVIYHVLKNTGKFFINGRLNPNLIFDKGQRYRFYVSDNSMIGVNFRFATSSNGTTYSNGVTIVGTPGNPGAFVEITVPVDAPSLLYYKQDGVSGVADSAAITIRNTWWGYDYWDKVSSGIKWTGEWSNATQYYKNDVVFWDGDTYIALADSVGEIPNIIQASRAQFIDWSKEQPTGRNNHVWMVLAAGQRRRRKDLAMWLPNTGPINWPYLHNDDNNSAAYRKSFYISVSGRVYGMGGGTASNHGYNNGAGAVNSYWTEVPFRWYDWWKSKDATNTDGSQMPRFEAGQQAQKQGYNDRYNRSGEPPKCIQIEMTYGSTYFLFDNGEMWAIGHNAEGEKGVGVTGNKIRPVRVQNLHDRKIIKMSVSKGFEVNAHHCVVLDDEGCVWTWGYNAYGQLGHGHDRNTFSPRMIPKQWLDNEEIIDILAAGNEYGTTYVRTKSNNIYCWGYNAVGQLGIGDTTNRWKPVKMASFNPVTNGGILKFSMSGTSSGSFHLLDGNGYMWHAGFNTYGTAMNASTTQNNTIARSTLAPTAGASVNFWASMPGGYSNIFVRTTNGNTYFCGYNGSNSLAGLGNNTSPITSPTLVPNVTSPKKVSSRATANTNISTFWLTDRGEMWFAGYTNYNRHGNEYGGSGSTIENGVNSYPFRMAVPPSTKILDHLIISCDESTNYAATSNYFLCDNGQIYGNGFAGRSSQGNNFLMGHQGGSWNAWIMYPSSINAGYAN